MKKIVDFRPQEILCKFIKIQKNSGFIDVVGKDVFFERIKKRAFKKFNGFQGQLAKDDKERQKGKMVPLHL